MSTCFPVYQSMKRMKICFVATTYPRYAKDGSGRFLRSLAEALTELGHEVHVLAPFHARVSPFVSPVHVHHFRYIWPASWAMMGYAEAMDSDRQLRKTAYLLAPLFVLAEFLSLCWLMGGHKFDVIHAHLGDP